jgi:CSLREA domain-containing protein
MQRRQWILMVSVVLPFLFLSGLTSWLSHASHAKPSAAIIVDTLDDDFNIDGDCSLREAITAANDNVTVDACPAGDGVLTDTISFAVAGTITLSKRLSVTAGGPIIIDGDEAINVSGANSVRVFYVGYGAQFSINQLSVADGSRNEVNVEFNGGGIENYGTLSIFDSTISNNSAFYSLGGGIANYGSLKIFDSTIADNFVYPGHGSGIANYGSLSIANTALMNNLVGGGDGSGIWNDGLLTITTSIFSNNSAVDFGGGGITNYGILSISKSTFSNNQANISGGGIENLGIAQIFDCKFIGNQAPDGGGINNTGTITVSNSTFRENNANTGGGLGMETTTADGSTNISNSTFYLNYADAGGAIYVDGDSAQDRMFIANSTFVSNIADSGGAIYRAGGVMEVFNSILTDSPFDENCWGWILDEGHNIDSGDSCGFDLSNGSLINTAPLVGPLQNNGGDTTTHALLDGSPAIDAANPLYCLATDQRGVPRPQDGDGDGTAVCDIGSFEYMTPVSLTNVTISGPTTSDVQVGTTFTTTVSPISATLPINYMWQATGQAPVTHTSGLTDTFQTSWDEPGTQVITVTAENLYSIVAVTQTIAITETLNFMYLPVVLSNQGGGMQPRAHLLILKGKPIIAATLLGVMLVSYSTGWQWVRQRKK